MIRVIIDGPWISTMVIWLVLIPRVIVWIHNRAIVIIPPSTLFCLFAFIAFLRNPSWRHAVVSGSDAWWVISIRSWFLSLVNNLRATPWWALFFATAHVTVLFHTLSPLRPRLSANGISLIQNTWSSKCIAELTWEIVTSIFLIMATVRGITFASTTLYLSVETSTGFEIAIAKSVLWRSTSSALLQKVMGLVVNQINLRSLLLLVFHLWLSRKSLIELCIAFIQGHIKVVSSLILKCESIVRCHHLVGFSLKYPEQCRFIETDLFNLSKLFSHLFHFSLDSSYSFLT